MHLNKTLSILLVSVFFPILQISCGGSAVSGSTSSTSGGSDAAITTSDIFPADLVIASPFATSSSSASINGNIMYVEEAAVPEDYIGKKEALEEMLTATSEDSCGFTMTLFNTGVGSVNCYGPSLSYTGHPDAPVGDPGMADGNSGGGDAGIWNETENGEACAVAQTNHLVNQVSMTVDTAINSFASMLCAINASGTEIPDAGAAALDVATILQEALTASGITDLTIDTATLEHQANDADGNDVYFFSLTGTAANNGEEREVTLYLKHIPLDDDNTTYQGKLSYAFTDDSGTNVGNCDDTNTVGTATTTTQIDAGSILYNKASSTSLIYRLQSGKFCDSSNMPLDTSDDYDISPEDDASASNPTGYANGFNYYLINMNPEDGTGAFSFSWVAGAGGENTRTLNITLSEQDSGDLGGCGYFGYGPVISTAGADLGGIDGFVCNWGMPASVQQTLIERVQRQCVSLDETSGMYTTDEDLGTLAIGYAPNATCSASVNDNFLFHAQNATEANPYTNDRFNDDTAVASELISTDEMVFTVPAVPDDVY